MEKLKIDQRVARFFGRETYTYSSFEQERLLESRQISVTGFCASGTSSLAKSLRACLTPHPFELVNAGDIQRRAAKDAGKELCEFVKLCESDPKYDRMCDAEVVLAAIIYPNLVIDARIGHCLAPPAFHVYLEGSLTERVARYFVRESEKRPTLTYEKAEREVSARDERDHARLSKRYPGCWWDVKDYDLVVQTDGMSKDDVLTKVLRAYLNRYELPAWRHRKDQKPCAKLELALK